MNATIEIDKKDYKIIGCDGKDGATDVVVTVFAPIAKTMIETFNKNHRKKYGINGLGKIDGELAKELQAKGKVSKRLSDKLYSKIDGLYNLMFSMFANSKIMEDLDRKVVYTDNHEVKKIGTIWQVSCNIWLEPEVKLLVESLELEFELEEMTIDTYVEDRIHIFAKLNPYLHIKDSKSEIGDMVELSVEATADDERIDSACEEATNIRVIEDAVYPIQLYAMLAAGVLSGQKFIIEINDPNDFPPNFAKDLAGKKVLKLEIKIICVYTCEDPKIDDDLSITAGYKTLEEWKKALVDSGNRVIEIQKARRQRIAIIDYLLKVTECGTMPDNWAKLKAQELGMPDNEESISKLKELFRHIIILKHIGKELGTEWDDAAKDKYDRDEQLYSEKVLQYLVGMSEFTYAKPRAVEDDKGNRELPPKGQSSSDREAVDSAHQA